MNRGIILEALDPKVEEDYILDRITYGIETEGWSDHKTIGRF